MLLLLLAVAVMPKAGWHDLFGVHDHDHETVTKKQDKQNGSSSVNYKCSCEDLYAQPVYQILPGIEIPAISVKWINNSHVFTDYQYANKQYISSFLRGPPVAI